MKRQIKNIVIPIHIWTHPDLSVFEKVLLIEIDSYSDINGCVCGVQTLANSIGLPTKTVKETLKSLQAKSAIEVRIDADGQKRIMVYLYKERYVENPNAVAVGDKPSDMQTIDYQAIIDAWNEHCGDLQKVERLTPKRRLKTRTTLKSAGCTETDLIKAIKLIKASAFLRGDKGDWSATYDWLIKNPENITKVLEGNYHKDYGERRMYEAIMRGEEVNQKQEETDFYR